MFSIRSQITIGVISSVLLTTIILVIAYKLMWFNGHMTINHYDNDNKLFNTFNL